MRKLSFFFFLHNLFFRFNLKSKRRDATVATRRDQKPTSRALHCSLAEVTGERREGRGGGREGVKEESERNHVY